MDSLDPYTLLVSCVLFTAAMTLLLAVSRVGLGIHGRGINLWQVGNLVMLGAQFAFYGQAGVPTATATPLLLAALSAHILSLRRVLHGGPGFWPAIGLAGGCGAAVALLGWALPSPRAGQTLMQLGMITLLVVFLVQIRRQARRSWGARLLMLAPAGGVVNTAVELLQALRGVYTHTGVQQLLLVSVVTTLLSTGAMLLWLQERLRHQLTRAAFTDSLTNLLNRHGMVPRVRRVLAEAQLRRQPVSVVLCDLDHFKQVNDRHGHQTGDAVLRRFAAIAQAQLRSGDRVARWGGEEFLVLLPGADACNARVVAERLRRAQAAAPTDGLPSVTVSAGVATADPDNGYDLDALISHADFRLYVAKGTRNRVVDAGLPEAAAPARAEAAASEPVALA